MTNFSATHATSPAPRVGELANFIWSIADLLRGDYKQSEYGRVILPLTVIRRLDAVLERTKKQVVAEAEKRQGQPETLVEQFLRKAAGGLAFWNTYPLTFTELTDDPDNLADNLRQYVTHFSQGAREVIEAYDFLPQITRLANAGVLYQVVAKFAEARLGPASIGQMQMGYLFEELIRRFSEQSNETAGEHFTPREVIRLMVNLLLGEDDDILTAKGIAKTVFDPACGTGGMLSVAQDWLRQLNPDAQFITFGQELNAETFAMCRSDLLIKSETGNEAENIRLGNSFSEDRFKGQHFDYLLANPPFGVEWKKVERIVKDEAAKGGGRFDAGLPRINDGSFLFLQHMISKMKPVDQGGSRIAIVFNGSPLFTGAAGSGESEIRRWILENDWLEGIVALPDQLFYNTGISTYFWIVSNRKDPAHTGKVILLDARDQYEKMRKSLGDKRKYVSDQQIALVTRIYADAFEIAADASHEHHDRIRVFAPTDFGYHRIQIEQPVKRAPVAEEDAKRPSRSHKRVPDKSLTDYENVPLAEDIHAYFAREVLPYVPDAWIDEKKTKVGYEIPFTRYFYKYVPPRPLEEIDAELREIEAEIQVLLSKVTK
ncbi:SAM-dependent DNA methyltransferase [Planctomonas sp. JC2975]|uniref:type I restriction-modification system subunit M n=1 Tax=Planctomonas sp. JC2975 TaxID=2729626 RepID=UPI00147479AF|nr:class I SAM-dependent DNA methyltransferase [Planctomonas sp. JC2975]NNC12118.1 SAM-dependent DNA methyltransferase [Planctomonas sp. JC2975]